jgi:hypothetical protein
MTPKKLKRGDIVRIVDGSEAHGDIGIVHDVQRNGIVLVNLAECAWPVDASDCVALGPLPVTRRWVVELEHDVWLAPWSGDPGRTCVLAHARVFTSERQAKRALRIARGFSPLPFAVVRELPCLTM